MTDINLTPELCDGDIENTYLNVAATDKLVSSEVVSSKAKDGKTICEQNDLKVKKTDDLEPGPGIAHLETLEDVIAKALEKAKNYFLNNEIEEQKLAEFILKILTLNANDIDPKDFNVNSGILDKLIDQISETRETKNETDSFSEFIGTFFGLDAAKTINDKLNTENVDEIVEKLLGKDAKKLICDRLESDNLDELLNKLIEEKQLAIDGDSQAKHPTFDDFIAKILGEETKEFIRKRMQTFLNNNELKLHDIMEVQEVE